MVILRVRGAELRRESLRCFASDLQVADGRVLSYAVAHKAFPTFGGVRFYAFQVFKDVPQVDFIVGHRGIALRGTFSRM
jgi:predicted TIM-barrel fold metal-dependent hydrolase